MPLASATVRSPAPEAEGALPRPRSTSESRGDRGQRRRLMRLLVDRPGPGTVVVTVWGEVDAFTAPRLAELLHHRLLARPALLVLDLSAVTFLSVAGLRVLLRGAVEAVARRVELRIVTSRSHVVQRILEVTGVSHELPLVSAEELPARGA
jgi:anti-sigma B factor antagonist